MRWLAIPLVFATLAGFTQDDISKKDFKGDNEDNGFVFGYFLRYYLWWSRSQSIKSKKIYREISRRRWAFYLPY